MGTGSHNTQNFDVQGENSYQKFSHPQLKSQLVESIVDNDIQFQPCLTIHYTHDETLEWFSCCQMGAGSHNTHNLGVQGGRPPQSKHIPNPPLKIQLAESIVDNDIQFQACLTIHYTHDAW
eukprot:scaffold69535_cov92-Cyclotella_meneghiniana.AAC.1